MKSLEVDFLIGPKERFCDAMPTRIVIDTISQSFREEDSLNIYEYAEGHWKIRCSGKLFDYPKVLDRIEVKEDADGARYLYIYTKDASAGWEIPVKVLVEPNARSNYIRLDRSSTDQWSLTMSSKTFKDHTLLRGIYFRRSGEWI